MDRSTILLCLSNLFVIAALPRIFFRPGRLNVQWWLTASPFVLVGAILLAGVAGIAQPIAGLVDGSGGIRDLLALVCAVGSVALIAYTLGSHREPVSLWHQEDDAPAALVTHGAYARVRHPFYAAFLLALLGCLAVLPHALTALALGWALVQLNRTARREEERLQKLFGGEYAAYVRRTGRFLPLRFSRLRVSRGAAEGTNEARRAGNH